MFIIWEQGWCSGEITRLPPMWPGVRFPDSPFHVGRVCCWLSSLLREVFLRVLRFSPFLKKPTFLNSNSTQNARTFVTWAFGSGDWVTTLHVAELKYWFDMWKSFFSADDWSSRLTWASRFWTLSAAHKWNEGLRNSGLHQMFNRDPYAMPVRGTGNSN